MRLPEQTVPPSKGERWLGQWKKKVCEPLLLWPEGCDQSSQGAMTLGHGRSQEKERMRTGPGRPKDDETHPRRRPGDPGQASNKESVSR